MGEGLTLAIPNTARNLYQLNANRISIDFALRGLKGALLFCKKIHTDRDYKMTQKAWKFSARWRSYSSKKSFKKRLKCGRWST